jgi:hypothetical protein
MLFLPPPSGRIELTSYIPILAWSLNLRAFRAGNFAVATARRAMVEPAQSRTPAGNKPRLLQLSALSNFQKI